MFLFRGRDFQARVLSLQNLSRAGRGQMSVAQPLRVSGSRALLHRIVIISMAITSQCWVGGRPWATVAVSVLLDMAEGRKKRDGDAQSRSSVVGEIRFPIDRKSVV